MIKKLININLNKDQAMSFKKKFLLSIYILTVSLMTISSAYAKDNSYQEDEGYYGYVTSVEKKGIIEIAGTPYELPGTVLATKKNENGSISPTELNLGDAVKFTDLDGVITKIEVLTDPIE